MSQNWMRHFELQLVNGQGEGISLTDFKVEFSIEWADTKWPRVANIKIYNLSSSTNNLILGGEFSRVRIIAGYDGITPDVMARDAGQVDAQSAGHLDGHNYGLIFDGDIRYTVMGKDKLTDRWIQIQVIDGWNALLNANTRITLKKGWCARDMFDAVMDRFRPYGVTEGRVCAMPDTVYPRGTTLHAPASDMMDRVASLCQATWQIVEGKINLISQHDYLNDPIVLNSNSGLVGAPKQMLNGGIQVTALINPAVCVNGVVHIDQASVVRAQFSDSQVAQINNRITEQQIAGNNGRMVNNRVVSNGLGSEKDQEYLDSLKFSDIANDGYYLVKAIDYRGDTRGTDWYMTLLCVALGDRKKLKTRITVKGGAYE